jgi:hypothetical protein
VTSRAECESSREADLMFRSPEALDELPSHPEPLERPDCAQGTKVSDDRDPSRRMRGRRNVESAFLMP